MKQHHKTTEAEETSKQSLSLAKITGILCASVIFLSVISCIIMAAIRSHGLTKITVTATVNAKEPIDSKFSFLDPEKLKFLNKVKQELLKKAKKEVVNNKDEPPDYELILNLQNEKPLKLGVIPNTSAIKGLTWYLNEPVSVKDVVSIQLKEQDKRSSDLIAEVQIVGDFTSENGYRFECFSERSMEIGVKSFFGTPVGKAISAGFTIAILIVVLAILSPILAACS